MLLQILVAVVEEVVLRPILDFLLTVVLVVQGF
jgi:hypothetical protein